MKDFLRALEIQRWDDHRFYHHSRINQTLHLISAISFLIAYSLLFVDPVKAALIGWLISMVTRQSGHFFFEPLGFDEENKVSNEYKEVGVVQAEDDPPGAHPAQRQAMRAQVELQHPVVARRPGVEHRPDRRQVGHPHRQAGLGSAG
jgi:hypothetical protein